jgi:hypothetical protein
VVAVLDAVTLVVAVVRVEEFGLVVDIVGWGLPDCKMLFTLLIKGYFPFLLNIINFYAKFNIIFNE